MLISDISDTCPEYKAPRIATLVQQQIARQLVWWIHQTPYNWDLRDAPDV